MRGQNIFLENPCFKCCLDQKKASRLGSTPVVRLKHKDITYRNDPPDSAKNVTVKIRNNNSFGI